MVIREFAVGSLHSFNLQLYIHAAGAASVGISRTTMGTTFSNSLDFPRFCIFPFMAGPIRKTFVAQKPSRNDSRTRVGSFYRIIDV